VNKLLPYFYMSKLNLKIGGSLRNLFKQHIINNNNAINKNNVINKNKK
jgi:hypothetical protein